MNWFQNDHPAHRSEAPNIHVLDLLGRAASLVPSWPRGIDSLGMSYVRRHLSAAPRPGEEKPKRRRSYSSAAPACPLLGASVTVAQVGADGTPSLFNPSACRCHRPDDSSYRSPQAAGSISSSPQMSGERHPVAVTVAVKRVPVADRSQAATPGVKATSESAWLSLDSFRSDLQLAPTTACRTSGSGVDPDSKI